MNRAWTIAVLAAGILGILGADSAFADSPAKKYNEYMKKYYEHMEEAYEEAADGDWGDYREELQKAQRYQWKAQQYAPRSQRYGGYYGTPRHSWDRTPSRRPGFNGGGTYYAPPPSHSGGSYRRSNGSFGFGR